MKTIHTPTLHSYARSGMFRQVDFTACQSANLYYNFTTLPVYSVQLRCAITFPLSRLSVLFPLTTFKTLNVDFQPYCLRTSADVLSMHALVDL